LNQDYSREKIEILVIDGRSEDKTREIIQNYCQKYSFIKFLDNPNKFTPFGLNIGIKESKGEIIIRMDTHAAYEKDYISKCVKYLNEKNVDNVGGIIKTLPGGNNIIAKAIALSLSHSFGAGNSYFRIGSKEPQLVDTVFGGCYKKEVFKKIGLYNEKMIRSQDIEFNLRLKESGGKILLAPDIVSYYYSQKTLFGFLKHNFLDGIWITYPLKFGIQAFSWRHLLPLTFLIFLIGSFLFSFISNIFLFLFIFILFLYLFFNFYFSLKISIRQKDFRYFFILLIVFLVRHIPYGLGSIWGIIKSFKKD
jgi:GT2 family glycosyltransferase